MDAHLRIDEKRYTYLSDRLSEAHEQVSKDQTLVDAFDRLVGSIHEETGFVARRDTDGVFGILIEVVELPHAGMDEDLLDEGLSIAEGMTIDGRLHDGTSLPTTEAATSELLVHANRIAPSFPSAELEVAIDDDTPCHYAVIRAFVPEGSADFDRIPTIAEAMHDVYERIRVDAPTVSNSRGL